MNIYLLIEDGDSFCIKAKTMAEAVNVCEEAYLEEVAATEASPLAENAEKKYYHKNVLESCSLVGVLKN